MDAERRRPADLSELLELMQLRTIGFYELSGRAEVGFQEQADDHDDGDASIDVEVSPGLRIRDDGVDVRCRLTVHSTGGVIIVDGAAFYDSTEPVDVPEEHASSFAEQVGIMTLLPYLRQAVDDLSMRLLFPRRVLIPVVPRGSIKFERDDD